jgi:hypothetical protein
MHTYTGRVTHMHVIGEHVISGGDDAEMPAGRECVRFTECSNGRHLSSFTTAIVTCMCARTDSARGSCDLKGELLCVCLCVYLWPERRIIVYGVCLSVCLSFCLSLSLSECACVLVCVCVCVCVVLGYIAGVHTYIHTYICICIHTLADSSFVLTGHVDGKVILWNVEKQVRGSCAWT